MKQLICLLFLAVGFSAMAQTGAQPVDNALIPDPSKELVLTGYLKNVPDDTVVLVMDPYNWSTDSAFVKKGRFTLTRKMPHGGSVHILTIGRKYAENVKTARLLYLEAGQMQINGDASDLSKLSLSGDKWVKEWEEVWRMVDPNTNSDMIRKQQLEAKFREATRIGDEDAAEAYGKEGAALEQKRLDQMREWIRKHPNSGVSAYLVTGYFNEKKERLRLLESLGDHAKTSRIYKRAKYPTKIDPVPVSLTPTDNSDTTAAAKLGKLAIGMTAPGFTSLDRDGKSVSLADFAGKYVFVDFWASWCGPCIPQIPYLKAANERFSNKNFVMLAISLDDKKEAWLKALDKHHPAGVQLSSLKGWNEPAARAYGATAIPFNVLIGPDGKILAMGLYNGAIEKALSELIK